MTGRVLIPLIVALVVVLVTAGTSIYLFVLAVPDYRTAGVGRLAGTGHRAPGCPVSWTR